MALTQSQTRLIVMMSALIFFTIVIYIIVDGTVVDGITTKTGISNFYGNQLEQTKLLNDTLIRERLNASEYKYQKAVKNRKLALNSTSIEGSAFISYPAHRMFWDFFYASFNCPHLIERIGRFGDGGKWVCGFDKLISKEDSKPCIVYSFGVAGDFSFEEEILSRSTKCIVRMFDPTMSLQGPLASFVKKFSPRVTFKKLGLGKADERQYHILSSLMRLHGDEFVDILKIDIEGNEYDTLAQIANEFHQGQLPFGQLQLEIHVKEFKVHGGVQNVDSPGKTFLRQFVSWWEQLEEVGLRAFHREANYLCSLNSNQSFVRCFEFSFLNIWNQQSVILQA